MEVFVHCPKCYAYAYDTLIQPFAHNQRVVDLDRIAKAAHILVPDFMRASLDKSETKHLWLMCIEAGGMFRSREGIRNSMTALYMWVQGRIRALGNLFEFHFLHTGGFVPEEAPPVPPPALRIRIPVSRT